MSKKLLIEKVKNPCDISEISVLSLEKDPVLICKCQNIFKTVKRIRGKSDLQEGVCICPEHTGEAGLSREEHAGSTALGSFHHCETRSLIYRAVDRRLRLPEPRQVRCLMKIDTAQTQSILLYLHMQSFKQTLFCMCEHRCTSQICTLR